MLEVKGLRFGYVLGQDIIDNVDFTIGEGEFIAVGGRNGCGKTTVTRLLMGLEKPRSGKMYYDGEDITNLSPADRGRFIGYVFQQPDRQMFRPTVAEEVGFGPEQLGYTKAEVADITSKALAATGISHLRDAYPPTLRRGEKQRVAIASALAMKSKILILDEPTSGQDGKETRELLELLETLRATGLTILLVTHDMEIMAAHCTRAIIIGYGTKAFDGTPEELFTAREDLFDLGLTKPPCVELAEAVPGLGYCKSMKDFETKMLARKGRS
ncbi:ABC transporter ATP-binding protein [Veillonella sp.]|uniref:energy-coupling factor ABC transporter ATP-binding protein n=1 Tax=Veillonella sp. TaxID=1926307 RepID=UPI0025D4FC0B|nr:ABC transporter ATP-binding protein [Veillonella sp.]